MVIGQQPEHVAEEEAEKEAAEAVVNIKNKFSL